MEYLTYLYKLAVYLEVEIQGHLILILRSPTRPNQQEIEDIRLVVNHVMWNSVPGLVYKACGLV